METVYQDRFQIVNYFSEHSFLEFIWQNTLEMTEEGFKTCLFTQAELVEKYKVTKELFDTKEFFFPISVQLQTWIEETIYTQKQRSGVKQFALVMSEEIIAQVSLEQAVNEGKGVLFNSKFFSSREKARQFLMNL